MEVKYIKTSDTLEGLMNEERPTVIMGQRKVYLGFASADLLLGR